MSRFNAKYILLFIILIVIVALSAFVGQQYSENFPISLTAIIGYLVAVITATVLALLFIQKSFRLTVVKADTEIISVEELFSYTLHY